jgi:hypothetical protein
MLAVRLRHPKHLTPPKSINVDTSAALILPSARSRNTLIRSISVRLIAIIVIGPILPN